MKMENKTKAKINNLIVNFFNSSKKSRKSTCKVCSKTLAFRKSNLLRHFEKVHSIIFNNLSRKPNPEEFINTFLFKDDTTSNYERFFDNNNSEDIIIADDIDDPKSSIEEFQPITNIITNTSNGFTLNKPEKPSTPEPEILAQHQHQQILNNDSIPNGINPQILETPLVIQNQDATSIFAKYLVEKLNQFDARTKSVLIHKINTIIFETEMLAYSDTLHNS